MKIKTSELTGAALDWAVAKCEVKTLPERYLKPTQFIALHDENRFNYSSLWAHGGPIIEREGITVSKTAHGFWEAYKRPASAQECYQVHPTPLIAAMRCLVASKLGDEVEVPDELAN